MQYLELANFSSAMVASVIKTVESKNLENTGDSTCMYPSRPSISFSLIMD